MRLPFSCKVKSANESVQFHIKFCVIEGDLPFLIRLPSLDAMGATLSYRLKSLSLAIKGTVHILERSHEGSHLRLPIVSTSYHRVILESNGSNSGRTIRNAPPISKNYYIPSDINKSTNSSVALKANGCEQNSAIESCKTITNETNKLTLSDLRKLHEQYDHASLTRMKSFLKKSGTWKSTYESQLGAIIQSCLCKLASRPGPRPVCSLSPVPGENQEAISVDIV